MADPTLLTTKYMIDGDTDQIGIDVVEVDGADLSAATATVSIYDAYGGRLVTDAAASATGTTTRKFRYNLATGAGTSFEAGEYSAMWKVTYGSVVKHAEQPITLNANPR